jgi:hypothetical protein
LLSFTPAAWVQTDEIQVYDAESTARGEFNLTWHNNFTPSGRTQPSFPGASFPNTRSTGCPNGPIASRIGFEAGTYLPVYTLTNNGQLLFDSVKLRALFVVPDAHDRTVFYVDVPNRSVTGAQTAGPGALNANAKNAATARKKNATT